MRTQIVQPKQGVVLDLCAPSQILLADLVHRIMPYYDYNGYKFVVI